MSTLAVKDAYGRQITQTDSGNNSTWTVPDVAAGSILVGPMLTSTPLWEIYRTLLSSPPSDYTGPALSQDPVGFFVLTVGRDATLAAATRNGIRWGHGVLAAATNYGFTSDVTAGWNDLISQYSISAGDQATVHNYALSYGIPGI